MEEAGATEAWLQQQPRAPFNKSISVSPDSEENNGGENVYGVTDS